MTTTSEYLWKKLAGSKAYREEFVAAQAKRAIPFQISALMDRQELTQKELAKRAKLTQGVISRAADPGYGNLTLNTIIRVAAGFDVAFIGKFVPFSDLVTFFDRLSGDELANVPSFNEDLDRSIAQDMAGVAAASDMAGVAAASDMAGVAAASSGVVMSPHSAIPKTALRGTAHSGIMWKSLWDKLNEVPRPKTAKADLRAPDHSFGLARTPNTGESQLGDERIAMDN